jgi:hypothetical protein
VNTSTLNVGRLVEDIGVSFGLPFLFLLLALVNIKLSRRTYSGLKLRLSLIFVMVLFGYLICSLMFQDREALEAIWRSSPVFYSLVYSLGAIFVVCGIVALTYWKLRPEMWRRNSNESIE